MKKQKKQYATINEINGKNYRNISNQISNSSGYPMNHSSIRNYILNAMKKFAVAICKAEKIPITDKKIMEIASSPTFQSAIYDFLEKI